MRLARSDSTTARLGKALAFASGVCGLSYELLYSRLLTTYLGDMLRVSATILATFLCGIGLGSIVSRKYGRLLWLVEIGIGLYALVVVCLFRMFGTELLEGLAPASASTSGTVFVIAAALAIPSTLVGFSVPLFARLLEAGGKTSHGFSIAYAAYNLGAGLCVVLLDGVASRIGVTDALVMMAALNLVVGLMLKLTLNRDGAETVVADDEHAPDESRQSSSSELLVLAVASTVSGIFQIAALRMACVVLGPFHQCFALLLFVTLMGLSLGTFVAERLELRFTGALIVGGLACALGAVLVQDAVDLWTFLAATAGETRAGTLLGRAAFLTLLALPGSTAFGSLVPALVAEVPGQRKLQGLSLGVSSFGNCAGYLLAVLVLLSALPLRAHFIGAGACLVLLGCVLDRRRNVLPSLAAAGALLWLASARWPRDYENFAYTDFESPESLAEAKRKYVGAEVIRKLNSQLSLVKTSSGAVVFNVNGYTSLLVSSNGQVNPRELVVGMVPAVYSKGHGDALVLGTGTGITAGTTAAIYDRTTVVEIDPAVAAALPRFDRYSFGLTKRESVRFLREDGLTALARSRATYDAIVSTVTSPMYFASAKLYTTDFFALARSRLKPGGVYVLWLDARITPEGSAVILETLGRSFDRCHFAFLTADYFAAICGGKDLAPDLSRAWPKEVSSALTSVVPGLDIASTLDALLFAPARWGRDLFHEEENTFDQPVLERLMLERVEMASRGPWLLPRLIGLDVHRTVSPSSSVVSQGLSERCYVLVTFGASATPLGCVDAMVSENGGELPLRFVELAARAQDATGRTVVPEPHLARAYLRNGEPGRAAARLSLGPESCHEDVECRCLHATLSVRLNGDVPDAELVSLGARAPLSAPVRRVLLDVSLRRGRVHDASAHLSLLDELSPLSSTERMIAAKLAAIEGGPPPGP